MAKGASWRAFQSICHHEVHHEARGWRVGQGCGSEAEYGWPGVFPCGRGGGELKWGEISTLQKFDLKPQVLHWSSGSTHVACLAQFLAVSKTKITSFFGGRENKGQSRLRWGSEAAGWVDSLGVGSTSLERGNSNQFNARELLNSVGRLQLDTRPWHAA